MWLALLGITMLSYISYGYDGASYDVLDPSVDLYEVALSCEWFRECVMTRSAGYPSPLREVSEWQVIWDEARDVGSSKWCCWCWGWYC